MVVAGEATPGPFVLADESGAVHRRFGAEAECFYLVRPDRYVGHRGGHRAEAAQAELVRRLGPSTRPDASTERASRAEPAQQKK